MASFLFARNIFISYSGGKYMENELDMLLDEYDELTEDLCFCKADLTKRRKLLKRRCDIRKRIEILMTTEKSLSK